MHAMEYSALKWMGIAVYDAKWKKPVRKRQTLKDSSHAALRVVGTVD
jgi:hypothetical protein